MALSSVQSLTIFIFICWIRHQNQAILEVDFDRLDCKEGKNDIYDLGDLRVRKFNRSAFILDGNFKVFKDLNNNYDFQVVTGRANLASNSYSNYPLRIPRTKFCDFLNGTYKNFQGYYKDHSNLPQVGKGGQCPLPKGDYYMKNYQMPLGVFPSMTPDGNWRLSIIVTDLKTGKEVINCSLYIKISHP